MRDARPALAMTLPSSPTTTARSASARWLRFCKADWVVAASLVATAARKPKSCASSTAELCSWLVRSCQMRSKTTPLASSSWRTARSALCSIDENTAAMMAAIRKAKSAR